MIRESGNRFREKIMLKQKPLDAEIGRSALFLVPLPKAAGSNLLFPNVSMLLDMAPTIPTTGVPLWAMSAKALKRFYYFIDG